MHSELALFSHPAKRLKLPWSPAKHDVQTLSLHSSTAWYAAPQLVLLESPSTMARHPGMFSVKNARFECQMTGPYVGSVSSD